MKQAIHHNEKGMVLIGALAVLALIVLVAGMAVTSTYTEIKISSNYKSSKQAFYFAEAGVQHAKAELKTIPFNAVLNGDYSGSLSFGTDTPFADGAYYNVTVEDNKDEYPNPDDPAVDKDNKVYIKGTGLKNGSKSSVEILIEKTEIPFPPIPGAITIIGEANTSISNSMDIHVDGRDWLLTDIDEPTTSLDRAKYAIALSNIGAGESEQYPNDAIGDLDNDIQDSQEGNFEGKSNTGYGESIALVDTELDTDMTSQNLQDFVDMAKQVADNSLMASDVPGGLQTIEWGSVEAPKITYFNMKPEDNGGADIQVVLNDDITGSGILIVEGTDLIFGGDLSWTGIVIVIGDDVGGGLVGNGSKEQTITGAFIVDEQDTDGYYEIKLTENVNVRYSSEAVNLAQGLVFEKGIGDITVRTWGDSRLLK
jgi:type II secretory pathway pseudopilin PulG